MKDNNLEFKNCLITKNKQSSISKKSVNKFSNFYSKIIQEINTKKKTLSVLNDDYKLQQSIAKLKKFRKFNTIAIIGMGGSILGTEAIYEFLKQKIKKKIYFFNDLNEKKIIDFKKSKKYSKVLFIIISKSGNTIETVSNFLSLNITKNNFKNIIVISEKGNNFLFNLSKQLNLFHIEHKKYLGGRYSVLSETGIIPSHLMEINITKLRSNLLNFLKKNKKYLMSSSIALSNLLNSKKYNNLILLNYSPELEKFLYWYQQLVAESLGKDKKGFLPVLSNVPKDHHSLLQLYLDGPKDKVFYIFSTNSNTKTKINIDKKIKEKNFLNKKLLSDIKIAQKNALIKVFIKEKIPFREFKIKTNDEIVLGKLFSYFILETVLIGKLSKINPFDQPAVEQVKNLTKKIITRNNQK